MIGKAWNARPMKLLRRNWRQFGKASLIKPKSILWLEPLALLLLFGLLLGLVWLALS
ncbi:hypothetical protein GO755_24280 [Spirosoma sp. HMF4905]|uniref:Uncharacterized protein n=1 Tax=Spirosoma arboris TaxID=2682092 RepID=A0A7K1SH97_9BACT|nr:hypothetical protein [Spirosoma arboris]MVM33180.1 hypothetical protein [Spirosoma arboris]